MGKLREVVRDLEALAFLGGGLFLIVSLCTYAPTDPSWNTACDAVFRNWLGYSGGCASDVLFQLFGISAFLVPVFGICGFFSLAQYRRLSWRFFLSVPLLVLASFLQHAFFPSWGEQFPNAVSVILETFCGDVSLAFVRWGALLFFLLLVGVTLFRKRHVSLVWQLIRSKKVIKEEAQQPQGTMPLMDRRPVKSAPRSALPRPVRLETEGEYQLPPLELIHPAPVRKGGYDKRDSTEQANKLKVVLDDFGIKGNIVSVHSGPVVTLYELEPAAGIKSSRVISLADDIARSMSAFSARVAVVPGKNVIGIELSNPQREIVFLSEILSSPEYNSFNGRLALALGKDIGGHPVIGDLTKMPHLLVAGTTGSGKSVGINSMILSLLYRMSPEQCRLIMIDPKMLELSVYDGIPHLLMPVVTEPKRAILVLKWVVAEMEKRYRLMSPLGVRSIEGYNQRVIALKKQGDLPKRVVQTGFDQESNKPVFESQTVPLEPLSFIVVVVDEMADLMLVAGKDLEIVVQRLAQMARAAGIHLIMATQRPSVDVITGTIKANFPTRISFQVTSKIDSRTILGEQGAEQLLGQGDMLYMVSGGRIVRVHGPFVSDEEVERVVSFLKDQGDPEYVDVVLEDHDFGGGEALGGDGGDALYQRALEIVLRDRKATTSYIQRQLQIGYNRAARLIEQMEERGVISPPNHVGKREILS